jgi:hypothetical protein
MKEGGGMRKVTEFVIVLGIMLTFVAGIGSMAGCGWLFPTEPSKINLEINGNNNDVNVDNNEEEGNGDLTNDDCGSCGEDEERDYSQCWSTCQSKNRLDPDECAACLRGERECVWPWEVDIECLQE